MRRDLKGGEDEKRAQLWRRTRRDKRIGLLVDLVGYIEVLSKEFNLRNWIRGSTDSDNISLSVHTRHCQQMADAPRAREKNNDYKQPRCVGYYTVALTAPQVMRCASREHHGRISGPHESADG